MKNNFFVDIDKMSTYELQVKKLTENAILPSRESAGAAGYDLAYSRDEKITIPRFGRAVVPIDISVEVVTESSVYLRVAPRSGLSVKHGIHVGAGVVDKDYRGNVGVVLFNFGENDFVVSKGDRVAQLIIESCYTPPVTEVTNLTETQRGEGGFGSTGQKSK